MKKSVPIWVFPNIFLVVGLVVGFGLSRIEIGDSSWLSPLVFQGGAEAARSLTTNLLSGIVSITTLTLTVTIVTLQLASSQYSPRLMKRYLRDPSIQLTVSFFLFAFAFTLSVLVHVRSADDPRGPFVPDLAMSIMLVVAVLALVGLVYFVFHVTRSVRVENVVQGIADDAIACLAAGLRLRRGDHDPLSDSARPVVARRSGFIVGVDREVIASELGEHGRLWFDVGVGDFVVEGTPCAWIAGGSTESDRIGGAVDRAMELSAERNGSTELAFGVRQIVDVGAKALSPGVNDPTTAIVSINAATRTLAATAVAEPIVLDDVDEELERRVVVPLPSWSELVFSVMDQLATYGSGDAQVARSIVQSMKRLLAVTPEGEDDARLVDTLDSIEHHVRGSSMFPMERDSILADLSSCRSQLRSDGEARLGEYGTSSRVI